MDNHLIQIVIFSLLITFSWSFVNKNLSYDEFKGNTFYEKNVEGISYSISYKIGNIMNNYIKIKIQAAEENEFLYAYYSPISRNRSDAYLLNSGKDEIYLYINKAFTKQEANGFIYLTIACFTQSCDFSLTSTEEKTIDLERNSQYKYFTVDKKNLVNIFTVNATEKDFESDYISFYASGNKNIQMNIKYVNKNNQEIEINSASFDNGKYAIFEEKDNNIEKYIIEVTAPANSLITFGNNINRYKEKELSNTATKYKINTNEIYGVLNRESNIQCFDFNIGSQTNSYLSIIDFNKNLELKSVGKNNNGIKIPIENGNTLFIINEKYKDDYFCLYRKNNESNYDSPFALQVTYDITNNYYKNIFSPQINGIFYERHLEKGQLAFYTGLSTIDFKKELRYYLKKNSGYPEMYFAKCNNYPNCKFDNNSLQSEAIKPEEINDMFSYSIYKTEAKTLIAQEQYVLLVYCNGDTDCLFQTNFYSELDKIVLIENLRTSHTIMTNGENTFSIKLIGEKVYNTIYVNFLTYTGDTSISIVADGFNSSEYLSRNKKYYVLNYNNTNNENNEINNEIYFIVKGELASFYLVDYKIIKNETDKMNMFQVSGIIYIETIEQEIRTKNISITNRRQGENKNFTIDIYSINCEIEVIRNILNEEKYLNQTNYVFQDFITNNDSIYNEEYYNYTIKLKKMDIKSEYSPSCMAYVSSLDQNTEADKDYQQRHLLVIESIINRIILNKEVPSIEYIYPHISPKGHVLINIDWQTNSKIYINISIGNTNNIYKEIVTFQPQYIIITENELRSNNNCPYNEKRPNQVCSIIVKIKLDSQFYDDEPNMEFTIRSKAPFPAYISKLDLRKDIVVGNYFQYFYTEVSSEEKGNIFIKFDRGNGKIYVRIVPKDRNEEEGWMNKFILPDENNNDENIAYNYYTRNIYYDNNSTRECKSGCYLLFKIEPNFSEKYYTSDTIAYPITLSIKAENSKITPSEDDKPVVRIPLNEFILGNAKVIKDTFDFFYSLIIPYDCEAINIEFFCESSFMCVNVGDKKPKKYEHDFGYKDMEKNGILKITKEEILNKSKIYDKESSIKNVQLTIAIGAEYLDDVDSGKYSFRVRAFRKKEIDLITLTIDQETLCDIKGKNGNCYFIIPESRKLDEKNNIFFHALYIPNTEFNYYAKEVPKEKITSRNYDEIAELLPNKTNCTWSNENSRANYLYIDNSEIKDKNNSYILLNLEVYMPYNNKEIETTISLLHSYYSYQGSILPSPTRIQLFLVNNNNKNDLSFKFDNIEDDLVITLRSVSGKGSVYWDKSDNIKTNENDDLSDSDLEDENIYYYFNNPGDTVSLTLGKEKNDRFPLRFKNENQNIEKKNSNEFPGFGFICFYERAFKNQNKFNYYYLNFEINSIFNFRHTDFPFMFYSRIPDINLTFDVNIKLVSKIKKYESDNNINQGEKLEIDTPIYDKYKINATILDEKKIYSKDINSTKEKMKDEIYDPINKIFKIQFTPKKIADYNITGNNYVFIVIDKGADQTVYNDITLEISLLPSKEDGNLVEINKYKYGKIGEGEYNRYELSRVSNFYQYMRVEFSANNDNIYFTLNNFKLGVNIDEIDIKRNTSNFICTTSNGKTVALIKFNDTTTKSVFLSIFNIKNNQPSNFVFKYDISNQNNFTNITTVDNVINNTYDGNKSTLVIYLPKIISQPEKSKVKFVIKLIENNSYIQNESLKTISLIESKVSKVYKISNPKDNSFITLREIYKNKIYYVAINLEVIYDNYNELFSYSYLNNPTNYTIITIEDNTKKTVIILGCVFGAVLLIGLIFLIYCLVLKKGNLIKSNKLEKLTRKINSESTGELIVND